MSTIKIADIAHVRFSAPDLDAMKTFLVEFGLTPIASGDGVLYVRGAGSQPFLHATSLGEPGFQALVGDRITSRMIEAGGIIAADWPSFRTAS